MNANVKPLGVFTEEIHSGYELFPKREFDERVEREDRAKQIRWRFFTKKTVACFLRIATRGLAY